MQKVLVSWIGAADIAAALGQDDGGVGPVAQALSDLHLPKAILLCNYPNEQAALYREWLVRRTDCSVHVRTVELTSPVDFGEIYSTADAIVAEVLHDFPSSQLFFHLSPGTPAMAAVWLLLGKGRYGANFVQSSREQGAVVIDIPFDIAAEFIPDFYKVHDRRLLKLVAGDEAVPDGFSSIVFRSSVMASAVARAKRVAIRSVPVLLEGESGTGKELFARAIHASGPRSSKPFVAVNCGAIPTELVEAELFGHSKGAFTGADHARLGYFREAHQGTIFLDEIGELPMASQVKILRVLQEGEVVPVGSTQPEPINIRVLAATNRDLLSESVSGGFRQDLYYRLAVAVIRLPPLREREGDLSLLVDCLLEKVNLESREEPGFVDKKISPSAKKIILNHSWPGNVRELINTLRRMAIWSSGDVINEEDARESLLQPTAAASDGVLERRVASGINLPEIIGEVARHYLSEALRETSGNKTKAANLLGLSNYQTLTNWLKKYGLEQ